MKDARAKMASSAPDAETLEQKNTESRDEDDTDKNLPVTGCKAKRGRKPSAKDSAINR